MIERQPDGSILLSFHSQYLAESPIWERVDDLCDLNSDELISRGYLFRHTSEDGPKGETQRRSRESRTFYDNEMEPLIAVHVGHLTQEITWPDQISNNPKFEALIEDVTGFGDSVTEVHQDKVECLCRHGRYGVLVDGPKIIAQDRQSAEANKERSWQVLYSARQIKDWGYFEEGPKRGQLRYVVVDAPAGVNEQGKAIDRFYYFLVGEVGNFIRQTFEREGDTATADGKIRVKALEVQPGELPYVPFEIVGRGLVQSASMKSSAECAEDIFNEESALTNINYYQAFKKIVFTGVKSDQVVALSEHLALCIEQPDATVHEIQAGDPLALERSLSRKRNRLKRKILRQFNRMLSEDSNAPESADSKARDQKSLIAWYNALLDRMQRSENRIWTIHGEYEGATFAEPISIKIGREFELDDPIQKAAERGIVFSQAGSLGAKKLQKQIVIQQVAEMDIVPTGDKSEDEEREELIADVLTAKPEVRVLPGGFGGRTPPADDKEEDKAA